MDGHAIEHHVDSRVIPDKIVALVFFLIVFHVAAFVSLYYVVMVATLRSYMASIYLSTLDNIR